MQFPQEYIGGALIIKDKRVFVYRVGSTTRYQTLSLCPQKISSAMWAGSSGQVTMIDGKSHIYTGWNKYRNL